MGGGRGCWVRVSWTGVVLDNTVGWRWGQWLLVSFENFIVVQCTGHLCRRHARADVSLGFRVRREGSEVHGC